MAKVGDVRTCVQVDEAGTCTLEAWMPPPQLIPPLSASEVADLLTAVVWAFAMAWGGKLLGRVTRD